MLEYNLWVARHPQAAAELKQLLTDSAQPPTGRDGGSEAKAQQAIRLDIAQRGGMVWRNNVGATPARESINCPKCGFRHESVKPPVRYGLCNDSHQLNERFKSADLIGLMPVVIGPEHVGTTVGQFVSIEVKRPGWQYSGTGREVAQGRWLELIQSLGGIAMFATGKDIKI